MLNERDTDILQVEVEEFLKRLLEEYTNFWVGDRDGDVYSQEGRRAVQTGGEVRGISEFPAERELGR
jgi:hypothetical protein